MKVFTVYKHESKGYEAVKVGFSWPALIFHFWWMLSKGFLFLFIFYIAVYILSAVSYQGDINAPLNGNDFLYLILVLIMLLYPGFNGNSWLHKKFLDKGYLEIKSVSASAKEAAIAIAKNEEIDNEKSANSQLVIDEVSELIYDKSYTDAYDEIQKYEIDRDVKFIKNQDIWARAYALSDGDENKQKVIYVKLRAKELDFDYDFEAEQVKKKKNNKELLIIGVIIIVIIIFIASST